MSRRHPAKPAYLFALMGALASPSMATPSVAWERCPASYFFHPGEGSDSRLQCAELDVPLSYRNDDGRTTRVKVMRVHGGPDALIRPAISVNLGGPGSDNRQAFANLASVWLSIPAHDVELGSFRRIMDTYDLTFVLPRGLDPDRPMQCDALDTRVWESFLEHPVDLRWNALVREASRFAMACGRQAMNAQVDTDTHARDIDRLRSAMALDRIHLFGQSYGSWVALWYASLFPHQAGRTVLDGAMDIGRRLDKAVIDDLEEKDRLLVVSALQPMADAPATYGLGDNTVSIAGQLLRMDRSLRVGFASLFYGAPSVLAAIRLAGWVDRFDATQVSRLVETYRFSPSAEVDRRARSSARAYLERMGVAALHSAQPFDAAEGMDIAVNYAVHCNDTPWDRSLDNWKRFATHSLDWTVSARTVDMLVPLICALWPRQDIPAPPIDNIAKLSSLLIVNSEYDRVTPWASVQRLLDRYPRARAVKLRGSAMHGLVGLREAPCVEHDVGRYLLDDRLPPLRTTECELETDNRTTTMPAVGRDELR
ncbi:alpha/beta hydrolase [Luteibacter anthropi]|nr:alpha/beta hydrolase [Luteibacter anthropi]URX63644.1 alpha/beta hydrolase [Luteibacter anthropi]